MSQQSTTSEREQLIESAKMFEQIAEAQPDDYQTLETLEDTYVKLGQHDEALRTAKRMAQAYARSGMLMKAVSAYENVLQHDPNDAEATEALTELRKTSKKNEMNAPKNQPAEASAKSKGGEPLRDQHDLALGRFLVTHTILTTRQLDELMKDLQKLSSNLSGDVPATSLLDLIQERGLSPADTVLELLTDKYKLPHLPLEFYDVDADTVKLLPRDLCFKYLVMPIDRISRTLLVTAANPHVRPQVEAMSEKLGLVFQWYLNKPQEIKQVLQKVYRLGNAEVGED